jgi:hypothetical protein
MVVPRGQNGLRALSGELRTSPQSPKTKRLIVSSRFDMRGESAAALLNWSKIHASA